MLTRSRIVGLRSFMVQIFGHKVGKVLLSELFPKLGEHISCKNVLCFFMRVGHHAQSR